MRIFEISALTIGFMIIKILLFLAILRQLKKGETKYAIFQTIIYFIFDFIFITFFYNVRTL